MSRPCPGESVTLTCTVLSNGHQWDIPFLNISRSLLPRDQGRVFSDAHFQFAVTEVMAGTSIISTATVTVTTELNGILIVCRDGIGMLPEPSSSINILGEHFDSSCIMLWITCFVVSWKLWKRWCALMRISFVCKLNGEYLNYLWVIIVEQNWMTT